MSSAFVPFLKSGGTAANPPAALAAPRHADSAAMSGAFAAIVPNAAPGATPGSPAATCAHAPGGPDAQPIVTLKKDGDRVTHIHIQCACGQVVELECAY